MVPPCPAGPAGFLGRLQLMLRAFAMDVEVRARLGWPYSHREAPWPKPRKSPKTLIFHEKPRISWKITDFPKFHFVVTQCLPDDFWWLPDARWPAQTSCNVCNCVCARLRRVRRSGERLGRSWSTREAPWPETQKSSEIMNFRENHEFH